MKKLLLLCSIILASLSSFGGISFSVPSNATSGQTFLITASGETSDSFVSDAIVFASTPTVTVPANQSVSIGNISLAGYPYSTSGQASKFSTNITTSSTSPVKVTFNIRYTIGNSSGNPTITADYLITITINPVASISVPNTVQAKTFIKNSCGTGFIGSSVTYTVPAGKYTASTQAAANQLAQNDINANGQNYANANGTCTAGYYNVAMSQSFTPYCGPGYGYTDPNVTYTVRAGKYSATTQEAANALAQNDINENGQKNANTKTTGACYVILYNNAVSTVLTKNNCPPGSAGGSVTYTIPAKKYSDYGPRAGANLNYMINNDISTNGQTYANLNGTCSTVVYIKLIVIGTSTNFGIFAYFYNDKGATQPVFVNSLPLTYSVTNSNGSNNTTVSVSGESFMIKAGSGGRGPMPPPPPPTAISLGYSLVPSPNYQIIN